MSAENSPQESPFKNYNPESNEELQKRVAKLKEIVAEIERSGRRPSQAELEKKVFLPLDKNKLNFDFKHHFEDY